MRGVLNKRGASHFEMIFSFVFFVGFVFFLFMVLKPQDTTTLSGSVIKALYDSFEEEVHTNLSSVFLSVDSSVAADCYRVVLPGEIFIYGLKDADSYVTELSGGEVPSSLEPSVYGADLSVNPWADFFRVLISPEFEDKAISGCELLDDYDLGSVLERRVVSYSALENMTERYRVDYEGLRSDLRVPEVFDFAIVAESLPGIVMEPQLGIPGSVEVMSQDYVVEVLNKNGEVSNQRFTIMIW